jgi:AbrB family looped-hinge helix DNA binding protein
MHMSQKNLPVRMARNGRLSVPAKFRKALGLEDGGMVVLSLQDGEVRIRPIGVVLAEVQAMVAPYLQASGDSVEQFLADKRAEVAREELEYRAQDASKRRG